MSREFITESNYLRNSTRFLSAKKELMDVILEASKKLKGVQPGSSSGEEQEKYKKLIQQFSHDRGRDLYYPILTSGLGSGPFVELMDGSVKYDMITGIGINFFGHTHPDFLEEVIEGLSSDVMQGNLEPGIEMKELLSLILSKVGNNSRLTHGWMMCSGTMVNEVALKMVRQKRAPATKIMAFQDCFAGRSTAMQEITDNPGYRQGQPLYGEVHYLPFYDSKKGLQASIDSTLSTMKEHLHRFPDRFAAMMIELVQGEGGFQYAPREYYVRIFEEAKKAKMAVWVDEIQTFGRTGELFAYQKFGLDELVDIVTVGKMLQACMVLFTDEYNPKPGLVAGTFSGSTAALRTGKKVLELLCNNGYLGPEGKIEVLSQRFVRRLNELATGPCSGMIQEVRGIGGMIAFAPFGAVMDDVKAVLTRLFDLGVIAFSCGHGPYLVRLLPPLGVMTESDVDQVCNLIEKALLQESKNRKDAAK